MELCLAWFDRYSQVMVAAYPQLDEPSHFLLSRLADSQLNFERWLGERFNLLRVVVNKDYPTFSE